MNPSVVPSTSAPARGVQALHLSRHSLDVVATDVSERCIALARLTAGLNDVTVDLRVGDLFAPVEGETFDLVVVEPALRDLTGNRRTAGLPRLRPARGRGRAPGAGGAVRRTSRTAAGARCWPTGHTSTGRPWEERVGDWLRGTGCDAWVVQREQIDVTRYAEMWLDDAGLRGADDYVDRYDRWLSWFDEQGIESVGFGWLNLRRAGRDDPVLRLEEWPYDVEQPIGPHVADWARQVDAAATYSA